MASKKTKTVKKTLEASDVIDLYQGKDDAEDYIYSADIMQAVLKKGYCVIDTGMSEFQLQEMLAEVKQMNDVGRFERPPDEIVDGLLGAAGSVRMVTVETEAGADENSPLEKMDRKMVDLGGLISPLCPQYFGFELSTRSSGYVLEANQGTDQPAAQFTAKECMKWLNIFQWHRFMCLFIIGPSPGSLEMQPFDDFSQGHSIPVRPGSWIVIRADMLSHRFIAGSPSYTLSGFFMQVNSDAETRRKRTNFPLVPIALSLDQWLSNAMRTMKETMETEAELEALATREVTKVSNQMYHRGSQIAVRGWATRFPGQASNISYLETVLFSGCDPAEVVPFMRWNNDDYYNADGQDGYQVRDTYSCQHGTFIDGMEMFDHKFFGLSLQETRGMDPNQRHMLEICYETCHSAGFKKATLMRTHMAVYSGGPAGELEWTMVPKSSEGGALASTSGSPAILSNRISYTFGMNGPNYLMDMEAASSLLAFQQAVDCCLPQKPQADSAVALGVDAILHPTGLTRPCWAGLMSGRGRCLTFDCTADGYIRGEGCGGVFMNPLLQEVDGEFIKDESQPYICLASGAYCNNSGKTASLSSPSGSMDQELIAGCLKRAEISPLDVDFVDPHGAGSLLHDAVEVVALSRSYRALGLTDEEMLGVGATKSMYGNSKPAAGILATIKTMISLSLGHMIATTHLLRLNPHMLTDDVPVFFASDHLPNRMNSSFASVSAKGIGGANVHAILWGKVNFDRISYRPPALVREPISFWPGGGGELDDEAKPKKTYTIVGSWSSWSDPKPMEPEGKSSYGYTVTLGEHAFERFHIWMDGDPQKVLHPPIMDGSRDSPVHGPDRPDDAQTGCWLINGQPLYVGLADRAEKPALTDGTTGGDDLQWLQVNTKDLGSPGDQYRIQLLINGQYRIVTWEKIMEGVGDALAPVRGDIPVGKYYVTGNWTDWEYVEMKEDPEISGLFYLETQVLREGGTFNIVRNQDPRQTIYPEAPYAEGEFRNPVLGPDEHGSAYYWYLDAKPGQVYRIELHRAIDEGIVTMAMSWKQLAAEKLSADQMISSRRTQFYIVGTLGKWQKRHKMTWDGLHFTFEYALRIGNTESFQILMDGDWNLMIYPNEAGSGKNGILRGPDEQGQGCYWTIGGNEDERSGRYEVQLSCQGGRPSRVTWLKK